MKVMVPVQMLLALALALPSCRTVMNVMLPGESTDLFRGFREEAPDIGDEIPAVLVTDLAGEPRLLSERHGDAPLLLAMGSYSCPVFRTRVDELDELARQYGDDLEVRVLYTREAHPTDVETPYAEHGTDIMLNRLTGVSIAEPRNLQERAHAAKLAREHLEFDLEIVLDSMTDDGWRALGRVPSAAFLFDRDGRLVKRQAWLDAVGLECDVADLLDEPAEIAAP